MLGHTGCDTVAYSVAKQLYSTFMYICGGCPDLALVEGRVNIEEDAGWTQCRPSPIDKDDSTLPPGPESPMAESQGLRQERG